MGEDFRRSPGLIDSPPVEEINPIGNHLGWTSRWLIHRMKMDFPDPDGLKMTISSSFRDTILMLFGVSKWPNIF
jgi:hypothetical protein